MHPQRTTLATVLPVVTIVLGALLAWLLLLFGVGNLINPDVSSDDLARNTLVCVMVILTAAVLICALFRPLPGGIAPCVCAAVLILLIPNPIAVPILLLAVLSLPRGNLSRPSSANTSLTALLGL